MTVMRGVAVAVGELAGLCVRCAADGRADGTAPWAAAHALSARARSGAIRRPPRGCIVARGFYERSAGGINQAGTNVSRTARPAPSRRSGASPTLLTHQLPLDPSFERRAADWQLA